MSNITRVKIESCGSPGFVDAFGDGSLIGASACGWNIKGSYHAIAGAHETVIHITCIEIVSGDSPRRVDASARSPLTATCACARNIECSYCAILLGAHEAVVHSVRVKVCSRNGPCGVHVDGEGLKRPWSAIESGYRTIA